MTKTFDPIKAIVGICVVLMIFGVIGFNPVSVGLLLLGSMCELKFTWK